MLVRIERLTVSNFRNLADQTLLFSPGVNLLIGENGQGKTNLLESIQFFKFARSFRTSHDTELIQFKADFCRAEVQCNFDGGISHVGDPRNDSDSDHHPYSDTFSAAIEADGTKHIKVSGKDLARRSDLVGHFPCVLFGPQDLRIVTGGPDTRRRFVDMVGSMTDPAYIRIAREYKRILAQRNAALKARAGEYELNIWNEKIVEAGAALIEKRRELVELLDMQMLVHARELDSPFEFKMVYDSELLKQAEQMKGENDGPSLADVFAIALGSLESAERRRMTTLAGPHRDDVSLFMNGTDLRKFGSQGQRRLFAILLKLGEVSHLERELKEPSVLLLDDVFSEFDREIIKKLEHLLDGSRQVFVTSPVDLEWAKSDNATVWRVSNGMLSNESSHP